MNTFNAIAKSYKPFWASYFCQIVAIHPEEDFNQIWLQSFFYFKMKAICSIF
jgi:hypothetical protein